ncbi:MAG TPA: XRE family transcriptional regulator, partial [Sphingomicrobium sp.]|nr:XRE family transcriptional regulator [Sphingomicrobium sp.]
MNSMSLAGAGFITRFIDKGGVVDVGRVADTFRMTKGQLAETIGLRAATIGKAERRKAPRTQSRVREMLEIVSRVREWAGGETQAMAWYRSQPIPALDGRTPEALVKAGQAGAV